DFGAELIDALRYPLQRAARVPTLFGACMFGILSSLFGGSLATALPLVRTSGSTIQEGAVGVLAFGTALGATVGLRAVARERLAYVELVVAWTVKGKDEPPGFPDFVTIAESMFAPLARFGLVAAISFGPGVLLYALSSGIAAALAVLVLLAGLA